MAVTTVETGNNYPVTREADIGAPAEDPRSRSWTVTRSSLTRTRRLSSMLEYGSNRSILRAHSGRVAEKGDVPCFVRF